MRQCDMVVGVLFILSIINFALAAPVPVQEKGQAWVDVEHIPRNVITVLGKRGSDEKLMKDLFGTWKNPVESSQAHTSSSSAAPAPDRGSMNDMEGPVRIPASLPTNPEPLMEPLSLSPLSPLSEETEKLLEELLATWDKPVESSDAHASSSSAPPVPDHGPMNDGKAPAPNPVSSSANPDPLMDPLSPSMIVHSPVVKGDALSDSESDYGWLYDSHGEPIMPIVKGDALSDPESDYGWLYDSDGEPIIPIVSPTPGEHGSDHELTEEHVPQPKTNPEPSTSSDSYQDFDSSWDYWTNLEDQPPPKRPNPESSKEFGQAHEDQEQQPNPGSSNPRPSDPETWIPGPSNPRLPTGSRHEVVIAPSPNPVLAEELKYEAAQHESPPSPELTDPKLHSDDQSSNTDSQPVDLPAPLYAAKGKSKELRGIPDTTRDRELRPG